MEAKKGSIVIIDGQPCQLTDKPKRAIDGSWSVFYRTEVGGKVTHGYATEEELATAK